VYRFLAIVLLVLLPLQFSWAAVASYCGHDAQAAVGHFGHHEHQHQHAADVSVDASEAAGAALADEKTPVAMHADCGHCHGYCSAMLTLPSVLPGALSSVAPHATPDQNSAAIALARPERPQWLPLA